MCFRVDPRPPEREREKKKTGTKVCGDRSTDRVDVEQICRQFIDLSGLKQAGRPTSAIFCTTKKLSFSLSQ